MAIAIKSQSIPEHHVAAQAERQRFAANEAISRAEAEARSMLAAKGFDSMTREEKDALLLRVLVVLGLMP